MTKASALALALLLVASSVVLLVPGAGASYSVSLAGDTKFQAQPWAAQVFDGSVVVGLSNTSQSFLDISVVASGDIAQWLSWKGATSFRLQPGERRTMEFNVSFPAKAPGSYTGQISASGQPPSGGGGGGASAPGAVSAALGAAVSVPALVYLSQYSADGSGARATVSNFANATFDGNLTFNLTQGGAWIETRAANATSLAAGQSLPLAVPWSGTLQLGTTYTVAFNLTDAAGAPVDLKHSSFRLPTPADIVDVWHEPTVVYADDDAMLYATVQTAAGAQCDIHYSVSGGAAQSFAMAYDQANGRFSHFLDNASYGQGDIVTYWATSTNGQYSNASAAKSFTVFSNMAPDLEVRPSEIYVLAPNPANLTANVTITVRATVHNVGRGPAGGFFVSLSINGEAYRNNSIPSLGAGNHTNVDFVWRPDQGGYTLSVVADSSNALAEPNEDNNYASLQAIVNPAPPPSAQGGGAGPITLTFDPMTILPFVAGIVVLFVIVLAVFRRRNRVRVRVTKVKEIERPNGERARLYTCEDANGEKIGATAYTDIVAEKGDVIEVRFEEVVLSEDGIFSWKGARVVKKLDKGAEVTKYKDMVRMLR
ncbi:MAG: hypothetical protein HZB92_08170 [Euryarchaeota archaeon]|nr:hypothetical protein [Euryarchaeota archaeon]